MPCNGGGGPGGGYQGPDLHLGYGFNEWIDAFCSVCTQMERLGIPISPSAMPVWMAHKQYDADRIRNERAKAEIAVVRDAALAKLSKEERDALGLRGE